MPEDVTVEQVRTAQAIIAANNLRFFRVRPGRLLVAGAVGAALVVGINGLPGPDGRPLPHDQAAGAFGGLVCGMVCYLLANRMAALGSFLRQRALQSSAIDRQSSELQDQIGEDFFNNLVKINFKYIDKYYLQTQIQADKSFSLSAVAAGLGFAVMLAGVGLMLFRQTTPALASMGAGLVSQFIAAIFFYLYNQTIIKMADYHRKLVLTQNVGLALRITQDLPDEQRWAAQLTLVDRLSADINDLLARQEPG